MALSAKPCSSSVMTLPQCANADGNLPSCAPLANPYVPFQQTGPELYQAPCALIRGTLFPGLDLPYGGQENTQEKLATASVELQQMGCRSWRCTSTRTRRTTRRRSCLTSMSRCISRQSSSISRGMDRSRSWTRRQAARMTGSRDRGPGNTERSGKRKCLFMKRSCSTR